MFENEIELNGFTSFFYPYSYMVDFHRLMKTIKEDRKDDYMWILHSIVLNADEGTKEIFQLEESLDDKDLDLFCYERYCEIYEDFQNEPEKNHFIFFRKKITALKFIEIILKVFRVKCLPMKFKEYEAGIKVWFKKEKEPFPLMNTCLTNGVYNQVAWN